MTDDKESLGAMIDRIQSVDRSQRKPTPVEYRDLGELLAIPTFMLRGHPDCTVEPVEVVPVRRRSPEAEARKINRECAERLAHHHQKFLAKGRKDRKANKIKKKLDAVLSEHRY